MFFLGKDSKLVMKLFLCSAYAGDYEPTGVVVAETEEEAEEKFKKELDDEGIWYAGCIVTGKQFHKDRKSTRLNSSHSAKSRMPSSA